MSIGGKFLVGMAIIGLNVSRISYAIDNIQLPKQYN